jgi:hypothetical protein
MGHLNAGLIQWPATAATIIASWLVASRSKRRRQIGFWGFLASNALWVAWAVPARAWGLVVLQVVLAIMNIRGVHKNVD